MAMVPAWHTFIKVEIFQGSGVGSWTDESLTIPARSLSAAL
jgi:hypothetical protein